MPETSVRELLQLTVPISCHCWNRDRTMLALSPNNNEVHIYRRRGPRWDVKHVLDKHIQRVTGMDWAPKSNKLVTCAADRNAYVWNFNGNEWKPTLVIVRIHRAATVVKWSPRENKFAVGSGDCTLAICYTDEYFPDTGWWVSKHIKKPLHSTILSIDWHPNNCLVAAGGCDFKARVFSAYIKGIEEKPDPTPWGKKMAFGTCMEEYWNGFLGGWIHDVAFSPSGNKLAWTGHDASISVVDAVSGNVVVVQHQYLPYLSCVWATENSIIAGGYDCFPVLWNHDDQGKLTFVSKLDQKEKKSGRESLDAMSKFKGLDERAQEGTGDTSITSTHQNAITQIFPHTVSGDSITKFSTTGVDGRLVIWDIKSLESAIAGLKFQ